MGVGGSKTTDGESSERKQLAKQWGGVRGTTSTLVPSTSSLRLSCTRLAGKQQAVDLLCGSQ